MLYFLGGCFLIVSLICQTQEKYDKAIYYVLFAIAMLIGQLIETIRIKEVKNGS